MHKISPFQAAWRNPWRLLWFQETNGALVCSPGVSSRWPVQRSASLSRYRGDLWRLPSVWVYNVNLHKHKYSWSKLNLIAQILTVGPILWCPLSHRKLPVVVNYMFLFSYFSFWHKWWTFYCLHFVKKTIENRWSTRTSSFRLCVNLSWYACHLHQKNEFWTEKHVTDDNWYVSMWWVT